MLAAAIVLAVWFVAQGGLKAAWLLACRNVANVVHFVVVGLLWLEYRTTSARRRAGKEPARVAVAAAALADRLRSAATTLHDQHPRREVRWVRWPLAVCAGLVIASTVGWQVMTRANPTSDVTYGLSRAFEAWRAVEAWADVPDDRRAARGPALRPPAPAVASVRRRRTRLQVRLTCGQLDACAGTVLVTTGGGRRLRTRRVRVARGEIASLTLWFGQRPPNGVLVTVAETERRRAKR
jgi:hypothetical protein